MIGYHAPASRNQNNITNEKAMNSIMNKGKLLFLLFCNYKNYIEHDCQKIKQKSISAASKKRSRTNLFFHPSVTFSSSTTNNIYVNKY